MPEQLKHIKNYFNPALHSGGTIHFPEPLKKKVPERKRMTIAIGLMATDGMVVAADTEESGGYPGDIKVSGHKVFMRSKDGKALAITGAGDAGYLDAVAQQLEKDFLGDHDHGDMEAVLTARFENFYDRHIIPLYQYERRFPDPDINVILAADFKSGQRLLLANQRTSLRSCADYVAVGSGSHHANMLLSRIYSPSLDVDQATLLAAFVVFNVKEYVAGCGKHTEVFTLSRGEITELGPHQYKSLDSLFEEYAHIESSLVHHILGRAPAKNETADKNISKRIKQLRSKIMDIGIGTFALSTNGRFSMRLSTKVVRGHNERGKRT